MALLCRQHFHMFWSLCGNLKGIQQRESLLESLFEDTVRLNPTYSSSIDYQTLQHAALWHDKHNDIHGTLKETQRQLQQRYDDRQHQKFDSPWLTSLRIQLATTKDEVSDGFLFLHRLWCPPRTRRCRSGPRTKAGSSQCKNPSGSVLSGMLLSRSALAEATAAIAAARQNADNCSDSSTETKAFMGRRADETRDAPVSPKEFLLLLFAPEKYMPWRDLELLQGGGNDSSSSLCCCCDVCSNSGVARSHRGAYPLLLLLKEQFHSQATVQHFNISGRPTAQQTAWLLLVAQALQQHQKQNQQQNQDEEKEEARTVLDVGTPYCIKEADE